MKDFDKVEESSAKLYETHLNISLSDTCDLFRVSHNHMHSFLHINTEASGDILDEIVRLCANGNERHKVLMGLHNNHFGNGSPSIQDIATVLEALAKGVRDMSSGFNQLSSESGSNGLTFPESDAMAEQALSALDKSDIKIRQYGDE